MSRSNNRTHVRIAEALASESLRLTSGPVRSLFTTVPNWAQGDRAKIIRDLRREEVVPLLCDDHGLFRYPYKVGLKNGVFLTAPGHRREPGAMSGSESVAIIAESFRNSSLSSVSLTALCTAIGLSNLTRSIYHEKERAHGRLQYHLQGNYWDVMREFWRLLRNPIFANVPNWRYGGGIPEEALLGIAEVIYDDLFVVADVMREPAGKGSKGRDFLVALYYSGLMSVAGHPDVYRTKQEIAESLNTGLVRDSRGFPAVVLGHLNTISDYSLRLKNLLKTYGRDLYLSKAEKVLEVHANLMIRELMPYLVRGLAA